MLTDRATPKTDAESSTVPSLLPYLECRRKARALKLNRRRNRRWRAKKRKERAILEAQLHPTIGREESLATEEAASLA